MIEERKLSLAEARIGLSVITCLMAILGFAAIERLGHSPESPAAGTRPAPPITAGAAGSPLIHDPQVLVLPATEGPGRAEYQTSYRPQWLPPQNELSATPRPRLLPEVNR